MANADSFDHTLYRGDLSQQKKEEFLTDKMSTPHKSFIQCQEDVGYEPGALPGPPVAL